MVAPERAQSNVLPFQFPVEDLVSTTAYKNFVLEGSQRKKKKYVREDHCDGFDRGDPGRARGLRKEAGSGLFAGFRSLFQGDHLGVEFAVQSHEGLLKGGDASQLGLVVAPPLDLSGLAGETLLGNTLALMSQLCYLHRRPCGKEQPRLSKMCWTSPWQHLLRQCGFSESVVAFGSQHKKEFRFLTYMLVWASACHLHS